MKPLIYWSTIIFLLISFGCKNDNGVIVYPFNKPEGKVTLFNSDGTRETDQSGAIVSVKDSSISTTTDINGRWTLNLSEGWYTLIFSKNGYGIYQEKVYIGDDHSGGVHHYSTVELYKPASFNIYRVAKKDSSDKTAIYFEVAVKNISSKRISIILYANPDSAKLSDSLKSFYQHEIYGLRTFDIASQTTSVIFSVSRFYSGTKGQKIFIRACPYIVGNDENSYSYLSYFETENGVYKEFYPYFGEGVSPINSFILTW